MPVEYCWSDFVTQLVERERQRRRELRERVRECTENRDWWDPRGWICVFRSVVRYIWETITEIVEEVLELVHCEVCELQGILGFNLIIDSKLGVRVRP